MNHGGIVEQIQCAELDVTRILELNVSEYGPDDILAHPVDFNWRCRQNPAGEAVISVIRTGEGDIGGFIWLVPLKVRVNKRDYLAATGTNLIIQPEYRDTFAYTRLIRQFEKSLRENGYPFHFSFISEEAFQRLKKRTPQAVSTVPLLVKPRNLTALFQPYFTKQWPLFISKIFNRLIQSFFPDKNQPVLNNGFTIQVVRQFDDRFDAFWERVRDKYPVATVRDKAFLTWRFTEISDRHYHIITIQKDECLIGYVVLRVATVRGLTTGLILDFLVEDTTLGTEASVILLAEADAYFRTQETDLNMGLMNPAAIEYKTFIRAGYKTIPSHITPRSFRFACFIHDDRSEQFNQISLYDWFITFADYESY